MNSEDIMRIAGEIRLDSALAYNDEERMCIAGVWWHDELERFGALVAAAEREKCAKEAIAVLNKRYMGDNNREDMEVRRCVEDLKKHFGVEE